MWVSTDRRKTVIIRVLRPSTAMIASDERPHIHCNTFRSELSCWLRGQCTVCYSYTHRIEPN